HPRLSKAIKLLSKAQESVATGAMLMLTWSQSGKLKHVDLHANRYLEMMGATTVAWLLLDAAIIAENAAKDVMEGHPDKHFYEGKVQSALFFANNNLPLIPAMVAMMQAEDESALAMDLEAFATI
ncbi:MAG: acyl-CoA dehydrogenase, partial [Sorangium cellulosum]